ncbi:hypothetical protein H9Q70_006566 [Fusarium xylarioides]|nr:hypothetical protein H9Q70_006566 [Fusarium xylarioides]KAG5780172.1 hypothetical protein H9Q73_006177 [Fusarium xylarioides]
MANEMTRGMWFNPIVIDDEPEAVKQEIPFAPGPVLTPGPITAYPPVRFGIMRTRNQLCRLLQEAYNTSPEEFHQKID